MTWHIQSECFISEKHTNAKFKFVYDIDSWLGKCGTVGWYPTVGRILDLKWGFYILGIFNFLQQPLSLLALITCTNHENSNRGRTQSNNLFPALTTIEKSLQNIISTPRWRFTGQKCKPRSPIVTV